MRRWVDFEDLDFRVVEPTHRQLVFIAASQARCCEVTTREERVGETETGSRRRGGPGGKAPSKRAIWTSEVQGVLRRGTLE
mmetsp:Transcript_17781/g.49208  ORF Transcript_17781/g.49208 Transcript_17781/m.49208 type:complete len:81 (-) Transcript_17781:207-449(-)